MTAGCSEIIRSPPETARKQKPAQKREVLAERQMNQGRFVEVFKSDSSHLSKLTRTSSGTRNPIRI